MALPALTAVQQDFSGGQITEKAARRDDAKIQRSGLRRAINTRALATGALAQRYGRAAYLLDTGRTELVRLSDTRQYEFLFGAEALRIYDADGDLLNEFSGLPWTLDTIAEIGLAVTEREAFVTYRNNRPYHLTLAATAEVSGSLGTAIGNMTDSLAFPEMASASTSKQNSQVTSHAVALQTADPGDRYVILFRTADGGADLTHTTPDGWTLEATRDDDGRSSIFSRAVTGSEGSSVTIVTSHARRSVAICHRITGGGDIEAAFAGSATVDPPSLTPTWGSSRTLWLAMTSFVETDKTVTAAPASYSGLTQVANTTIDSNAYARAASAWRQLEASSTNPGAFTLSASPDGPHAATVAIRPLDASGELAKAFDGNTNKPSSTAISKSAATSAYVGLDLSDNPRAVSGATVYGSNNQGYVNGLTPSVTLTLYGKTGSAPSAYNDGTSLGTATFTDTANESDGAAIVSSDTATLWDYLWIAVTHNGAAAAIYVAQVVFTNPDAEPDDDSWALDDFRFDETPEGALRQPYVRYAARGIELLPSAATGSITLTFSQPVLASGHVGVMFRYHERAIVITAVSSATSGTGNVLETLPPTMRVICASADDRNSFRLGQVVIGDTSGAEGLVVAYNSTANIDVIVYKGGNFTDTERIVSATGRTVVTGTPSSQTLAASTVWDEAAMSDYRGWPRSINYDRSRLILCDFPQLPGAMAESAIGAPQDFLIGAEADDAFLEFVPGTGRVLHVVGGADQFVLTDLGAMYIPISSANPLAPGSVEFRPIAAMGASSVRPVSMHEGVVYAAVNGKALIAIVPTGQTSFPYRTAAVSEFHADIFTGVRALAAMSGGGEESEQYLWAAQDDGSAVVGKFDSSNEWAGFVPVTGDGLIRWVTSLAGDVRFNVQYQDDDSAMPWAVEELAPDHYLDCAVSLNRDAPPLRPSPEDESLGRLWFLAGLTVDLMDGTEHLGAREVDEDGFIDEQAGDDFSGEDVVAGFGFTVTVSPYLPNVPEGEERGQRVRRRKVKRAAVHVQDSTAFTFMGRTCGGVAPADGTYRAPGQGRAFAPEVLLVKSVPGPFILTEMDVAVTT